MVWELEGPTPILYRSKRLVVTDEIVSGNRERGLVVSATQMVVYVLKGHDFSRAANGAKKPGFSP
jgi:hypothetical protein